MHKFYYIHEDMTPQQVLRWCNSLLEDCSLQIRADKDTYYLKLQALSKSKNRIGHIYFYKDNLLKPGAPHQQYDLFVDDDDDPPQPEVLGEPVQPHEVITLPPPPHPPTHPQQQ